MKRGRAWWAAAAFLVLILLLGLVPVSVTARDGSYVSYHVEAAGKNLRYQWQYWDGQGWSNTGDDWNSGTDTMIFQTWPGGNGLSFRCVVWNALNGEDWAFSDTVSLTVY